MLRIFKALDPRPGRHGQDLPRHGSGPHRLPPQQERPDGPRRQNPQGSQGLSRLDGTYDAELRQLIRTDLLILDDLGLDQLDADGSRDIYEIIVERHRCGSMIVTSNREPQEWLAMMTDPMRAQSAVDRLANGAYELLIEGESYRKRHGATAW